MKEMKNWEIAEINRITIYSPADFTPNTIQGIRISEDRVIVKEDDGWFEYEFSVDPTCIKKVKK
jgi:hypothetical protein